MSSVNKSPDFWWVHFHPISHFCSVVNHGKTKFVTLDYIVKKFSLFYDSPLIRESVTPALISWNIPKGKFPKGSYKNILWRKKNRDICIWSKIFQFSRMDPNGIYDITSSIFSPSFLRCDFFFVPFLWVSSWQIALLFKAFTIPIGMHWPKQWGAKVETMNQKMDSISKSMLRLNCELHFVWLYWGKHRRMMRCSLIRNKGEPFRKTNVSASNPLTVLFGDISE